MSIRAKNDHFFYSAQQLISSFIFVVKLKLIIKQKYENNKLIFVKSLNMYFASQSKINSCNEFLFTNINCHK